MLNDRTALITGGAKGIGAATAAALSRAGATVIIADLDLPAAEATAASIADEGGRASAYQLDVADADSVVALAARLATEREPISILVNNAGIVGHYGLDDANLVELWNRELAINLTSVLLVTRAFSPALKQTRGVVVNLASVASFLAVTNAYGYQATKGGVKTLTQTLARELAPDGVRVNAVAPGVIHTDMSAPAIANPEWLSKQLERIPLNRVGAPPEVADAILFLCSDMSRYITGAILPVDGGFLAI